MKFLKTLLPLMVTLLFTECGPSGNSFIIEGEFIGMKAGELYLFNPADPTGKLDTLSIADYKFKYEGEVEDTIPYVLLFPNGMEHVIFVSPAKSIKYKAATNDLKNYQVTGSEENELMNQFRQETSTQKENQIPHIAKQYIVNNTASPVALYLFDRYYLQSKQFNTVEINALLNLLKKQHPNNHLLFATEGLLKNADNLKIGNKVSNVNLLQQGKEARKLWADTKKDYMLIFFWATWIPNSYDMLWRVRQLQSGNSEKIRFIGISLDCERYRWEEQTKRDSLVIEHYCDGLSWSSPMIQEFGLGTIPYYIIMDKHHKVLSSGINVEQMAKDITKYVK